MRFASAPLETDPKIPHDGRKINRNRHPAPRPCDRCLPERRGRESDHKREFPPYGQRRDVSAVIHSCSCSAHTIVFRVRTTNSWTYPLTVIDVVYYYVRTRFNNSITSRNPGSIRHATRPTNSVRTCASPRRSLSRFTLFFFPRPRPDFLVHHTQVYLRVIFEGFRSPSSAHSAPVVRLLRDADNARSVICITTIPTPPKKPIALYTWQTCKKRTTESNRRRVH